jgi:hypothetical protein
MPWSRPFDDPIQPPKGKAIVTLKDAAAYILKLPKAKQRSPGWQAAGDAVIMAAEDRGPLMHARIGMLRALTGTSNACSILRASIITGEAGSRRAIDDQTADGKFSLRHLFTQRNQFRHLLTKCFV